MNEESLLSQLCAERIPVTVFLMNGFCLRGAIVGIDGSMVAVLSDGKQQFIYKHAISTIVPNQEIELNVR